MDDNSSKQWMHLHENMSEGKVDFNPNFYVLSNTQDGDGDIKLVTPTQQQVEQAKMQMKRKISTVGMNGVAANLRSPSAKRRKTTTKTQKGGRKRRSGASKKGTKRKVASRRGGAKRGQRGRGGRKKTTKKTQQRGGKKASGSVRRGKVAVKKASGK